MEFILSSLYEVLRTHTMLSEPHSNFLQCLLIAADHADVKALCKTDMAFAARFGALTEELVEAVTQTSVQVWRRPSPHASSPRD